MDATRLLITTAGLDALVNAQSGATESIQVASVGLTETAFTMAPTLTAVPGEFKRIEAITGQSASETIVHMTAQDSSADVYDLRGIGLFLTDGTLFAVYSQPTPVFRKVSIAAFLLALDIAFADGVAGNVTFGDSTFLIPPATETVKGVAEIATLEEASAATDQERIVTPYTLGQILSQLSATLRAESDTDLTALATAFDDLLVALVARTITGGGLVSGGGNLSASRVLSVIAATIADVEAGTASDRAVTPAALAGLPKYLGQDGYAVLPGCGGLMIQWGRFTANSNATSSVTFPLAFPIACLSVASGFGTSGGAGSQDNAPVIVDSSITRFGFSVFSADDSSAAIRYIAIGN